MYVESWACSDSIYENFNISILKNRNSDSSDKNNYRPIAIVTAMSKLFDLIVFIKTVGYFPGYKC